MSRIRRIVTLVIVLLGPALATAQPQTQQRSLAAYAEGHPYVFTQQRCAGNLTFLEKLVGTYVKDDWQVRPGLTTSFGLRYDWQNYFHDNNNVSPRASIAYAPGGRKTTVVRAGAGVFTDRSRPVVLA